VFEVVNREVVAAEREKNVRLEGGHNRNYLLRLVEVVKRGGSSQKSSEKGSTFCNSYLGSRQYKKFNEEISD
jgi:hypothetical protein